MTDTPDIETILASRSPRTKSRPICLNGNLLGEMDRVREMRDQARKLERTQPQGLGSEADKLEKEYQELVEKAAAQTYVWTAQAVDAEWLDELKRKHPPTSEQLDRYTQEVKTNPLFARPPVINYRSAGPELLAKAIVSPEMSVERAVEVWKESSNGIQNQLWNLAWGVQEEGADLPFSSAATATTDAGGGESNTPASGESPSQS